MPRVIHFELAATDPERASRFYSDVFDWKIQKWDGPVPYYLISTGDDSKPGINGGFQPVPAGHPGPMCINVIDVPDIDAYIEKVTASGGTITLGKTEVPGIGYLAYGKDTEGVDFGMMQSFRPTAP